MSTSKSRKTEIVAHVSKKVLQKKFPDKITEQFIRIDEEMFDTYGDVMEAVQPFARWSVKDQMLVQALNRAGIPFEIFEKTRQFDGYIRIDVGEKSMDLAVRSMSALKTAVIFTSSMDEAEHYEKVDEIVKSLAEKDVAVLRGECEITITTRC